MATSTADLGIPMRRASSKHFINQLLFAGSAPFATKDQ
jgi:hypothetical protein